MRVHTHEPDQIARLALRSLICVVGSDGDAKEDIQILERRVLEIVFLRCIISGGCGDPFDARKDPPGQPRCSACRT